MTIYESSRAVSYSYESPLRYPGGKSRAVQMITRFLPPHIKTLCSPFLGGGAVELYCAAMGVKVQAYDKFIPLVNFWQQLLSQPAALHQQVQSYHPLDKDRFYALQNQQTIGEESKSTRLDSLDKAAQFYVLNRASFSGSTLSGGMSPGHPRFNQRAIGKLADFHNPNLLVKQADFQDSLAKHTEDFLYLDPPYWLKQKLYGQKGDLHQAFDHGALGQWLKKRNQWILSYNDCETVRQLYDGFRQIKPYWKYGMAENKTSNELLIFSHDLTINPFMDEGMNRFQAPISLPTQKEISKQEKEQLVLYERIIEKGLKTFVEVGEALMEIKQARLYRQQYPNFDDYCQKRWGIGIRQSQRLIRAAKVVQNLQTKGDPRVALPRSERQIRPLAGLPADQQCEIWREVSQEHAIVTGKQIEEKVKSLSEYHDKAIEEATRNGNIHFNSESYEWYTPHHIIDATLSVLEQIDLDPCSNSNINPNIPAFKHFTKVENGLSLPWHGRVYLNPPYGKEIKSWVQKLNEHYAKSDICEAIALLPARTDTEWFYYLREYPRCFLKGRLNFSNHENTAPFPSVVFYLGGKIERFKQGFAELGDIFQLL